MDLHKALDKFYYSAALSDLRMMNRKSAGQNITYNSFLYLGLIFSMGGKCTASKIAELLYLSKPPVIARVNELVKMGLVIKTPDPIDHRQYLLSINEDADLKFRFHRQNGSAAIHKALERYSQEEVDKFCEMLDIISETCLAESD